MDIHLYKLPHWQRINPCVLHNASFPRMSSSAIVGIRYYQYYIFIDLFKFWRTIQLIVYCICMRSRHMSVIGIMVTTLFLNTPLFKSSLQHLLWLHTAVIISITVVRDHVNFFISFSACNCRHIRAPNLILSNWCLNKLLVPQMMPISFYVTSRRELATFSEQVIVFEFKLDWILFVL